MPLYSTVTNNGIYDIGGFYYNPLWVIQKENVWQSSVDKYLGDLHLYL